MATYKVKVPNFEGPLDLLLFFIKRDELDIYDIPIAHITKEFLEYIHLMKMLDLELAGEFIVMASILMQIKVRMLLPKSKIDEDDEEEAEDPRTELVRRLLEYKRYKEVAQQMRGLEEEQRRRFFRRYFKSDVRLQEELSEGEILKDVTMYDLIRAFRRALQNVPRTTPHTVEEIPYTIEEQGRIIMQKFENRDEFSFDELMMELPDKVAIVVTFVALLELMRAQSVMIRNHTVFNSFVIVKRETTTA
ncbi:MAG: segregation/condensation protein A [Chlorobi bacterium]|nr:segregation/condensation protein A [Chlorobiota bacterium]